MYVYGGRVYIAYPLLCATFGSQASYLGFVVL